MKYTTIKEVKGKRVWVFSPPKEVITAGLMSGPQSFSDGRSARYAIPRLVRQVEDFKKGLVAGSVLVASSSILEVIAFWRENDRFNCIPHERDLRYLAESSPQLKLFDLNGPTVSKEYKKWLKVVGISGANLRLRVLRHLCDFLLTKFYLTHNPCLQVKQERELPTWERESRKEELLWTRAEISTFIETCFTKFKWSGFGIIALITYHTLQDVSSVSAMTWDQVDLENKQLSFSGGKVTLPVPDSVVDVLRQQKEMWDFQQYVIPYHRASDRAYRPLDHRQSILAPLKQGGLPEGLKLASVQGSAIRGLLDSGVEPSVILKGYGMAPSAVFKVCKKEELHVEKRQDLHLHQLKIPRLQSGE